MRYRMLGPFEVLDGDDSVHLGGGRQRAFLVLLLLNANQVVSTDRIIDQLWGDEAPDTVANVIQVYVSRLRKALEPDRPKGAESSVLLTRRPGYMLKVDPAQIDAHQFEDLSNRGRDAMAENAMGIAASLFTQALDLWTGDVLADLAFEDFARGDIERLSESRLGCSEDLAEAQLALGQHEELVGELENLVGAHPLREQLWALLMKALYRSGRQAEALRAYRRAADILVEELGIDPSPFLQELEEQILVQDSALDAPAIERQPLAVTSPQSPPPLIGRDQQMAAIEDGFGVLANGRSVLITVTGEPGMGVGRVLAEVDRLGRIHGFDTRRARAFPTTATQPGEVLDQLGDLVSEEPLVVTVAGAEDCDPTSLAALRRSIVGEPTSLMVVLGLAPQDDRRGLGLDQLVRAVSVANTTIPLEVGRVSLAECEQVMSAELAKHLLDLTGGFPFEISQVLTALRDEGAVEWSSGRVRALHDIPDTIVPALPQRVKDLPGPERRLVEASALAAIPIPLSVVSSLLAIDEDAALDAVEGLVAIGLLDETSAGVQASPTLASGRLTAHMGDTRRTSLYADLASAFDGIAPDRAVGWFALLSNDDARAAQLLSAAGLGEVERGNLGEAQRLLEGAIQAKKRLGEDSDELWGELHLGLAQCHRLAGWSDLAAETLDVAVPLLSGDRLVDALGWAAQVADDRQRVAESEWWVARGEHAAIIGEAPEKLGSLLSLRARILNRLAFADESDRCAANADLLLAEHAGERQRFLSTYNRAWVAFDRGEMRSAESAFAGLIDQTKSEGPLADLKAWHGRALFPLGQVDEALAALDAAETMGRRSGDGGPVFLSFLGRAEGALAFEMAEEAQESVAEFTGLVMHQFPAWENIARYLGARLAVLQGDTALAHDEIANAIELSSMGPGGRRWLLACRAVQMQLEDDSGDEVDQLIDEARTARWHAAELPLILWAAEARGDSALAAEAVETGLRTGMIVSAIRAFTLVESPDESLRSRVETAARSNIAGRAEAWTGDLLGLID